MKIPIDIIKALESVELPPEWSVRRLEVRFERKSDDGVWASVIWDDRNKVWYVNTNKGSIYPTDVPAIEQGISVMAKANKLNQQGGEIIHVD